MRKLLVASLLFAPTLALAGPIETRFITATPTVDTSANASGDAVGGLMTFSRACMSRNLRGELRGVTVFDQAVQGVDLDLVLFNANPTATTVTTNVALDIADADLTKITAVVPLTTHKAFADNGVTQAKSISYPIQCEAGSGTANGTLYGVLVSRGAPTYSATTDITVLIEFFND